MWAAKLTLPNLLADGKFQHFKGTDARVRVWLKNGIVD
jgi:hypothetical protein